MVTRTDAFGIKYEEPEVIVPAHDPNALNNGHGNIAGVVADKHTEAKKLADDIAALRRNVERLSPEAAAKLTQSSDSMTAAQLKLVKAEVAKVENELAAKEANEKAKELIGGLLFAGGAGALLAGAGNNPAVLPEELLVQGRGAKPSPENETFARLLAGLDKQMFAKPENVSRGDLGGFMVSPELPNLVALEKAMKPDNKFMALG